MTRIATSRVSDDRPRVPPSTCGAPAREAAGPQDGRSHVLVPDTDAGRSLNAVTRGCLRTFNHDGV